MSLLLRAYRPGFAMSRHRHADAFIAIVLTGGFLEAGPGARRFAEAGTMLVRRRWEAHQSNFGQRRTVILRLPWVSGAPGEPGILADPDRIARLAESDPLAAAQQAVCMFERSKTHLFDWPDRLADDLLRGRAVSLAQWAEDAGICHASLSRGFRKAYGVTPSRYRHEMRMLRALGRLQHWEGPIAHLAAEAGFADQAHFTRSVRAMTGLTPARLAGRAGSGQAVACALQPAAGSSDFAIETS